MQQNSYERWAPNIYYVLEEHGFFCITNENKKILSQLASQLYKEYYYGLFLSFFHKIVLLKLANDYSEVNVDQDTDKTEKLIHSINTFTVNYFFIELATQTQGREIFLHLRKMFKVEELYSDARQTLFSLYKHQGNFSSKQNSFLLLILILYTVVGGNIWNEPGD